MQANALVNTVGLNNDEWLNWRTKGIGGSDVAAIAGLNPWKSPISVYLDKIGQAPKQEDNERMRIGRDLEGYVAARFIEATGLKLRRKNAILQHPEHKFMLANVDRVIVGIDEGLECKTTSSYNASEWKDDKIPMHYEIQCHHYMAVTGFKAWWIGVLIGNQEFVYKKIERDEEIINYLIQIEKDFWENNVLKNQMPTPDGSKDTEELINKIYPESISNSIIELDTKFLEKLIRRDDIDQMIKKLEQERNVIDQEVQCDMKEYETALIGDRKITWKTVNSCRFDSTKFKKDYPDLYEQYAKQSSYRRFQVK